MSDNPARLWVTIATDTAGALRAYDHYLILRTDPASAFRPQRDAVVAERAALLRGR